MILLRFFFKKMMKNFLLLLISLYIFNCGKSRLPYQVKGTIHEIHLEENEILIAHDTIKGLMLPMTMPFPLDPANMMTSFQVGDSVHFELLWNEEKVLAENFKYIGKGNLLERDDFFSDEYSEKFFGDTLDDASFLSLDSNLIKLSNSDGNYRFISFIFSRCPMPNLCPAIFMKNKILAEKLKTIKNLKLILISFDYIFDTPSVLKDVYGPSIEENINIQVFSSTRHIEDAYKLIKQSGGDFWGVEKDKIGHKLVSVLIDPDRKVLGSWKGDKWESKEVENSIKLLLK